MCILDVKFSQDRSAIICGTEKGILIYLLKPELKKVLTYKFEKGIGKVSCYGKTNVIGIVGGGEEPYKSKNILTLWDIHNKKSNVTLGVEKEIRNMELIKQEEKEGRIIYVTEEEINIMSTSKIEICDTRTTYPNKKGIFTARMINIANTETKKLRIGTLGVKKGDIVIWEPETNILNSIEITAHAGEITNIKLSPKGTLVATTSENGTNIHVYESITGKQICKLRRGTNIIKETKIYDICISEDDKYLACCSTNGTIHIFDLEKNNEKNVNKKSLLSGLGGYFDSSWSFMQHNLGTQSKMICEFGKEDNTLHIITYEGDYYKVFGEKYEILIGKKMCVNDF